MDDAKSGWPSASSSPRGACAREPGTSLSSTAPSATRDTLSRPVASSNAARMLPKVSARVSDAPPPQASRRACTTGSAAGEAPAGAMRTRSDDEAHEAWISVAEEGAATASACGSTTASASASTAARIASEAIARRARRAIL